MKHLIQQIILLIFYLVFIDFAKASYCYTDTNSSHYNLLVEEDGIYLQETVKDRNEISYVSQSKVRLKDITDKGMRVISDDNKNILILSSGNYYFIPKSLKYAEENKFTPLFSENEVSKAVANHFFLVSDNWYYASYYAVWEETYKQKIPELKGNMEIIFDFGDYKYLLENDNYVYVYYSRDNKLEKISHQGNWEIITNFRDEVLLKDDNAVYIFDNRRDKLEKIPHLTPSQTHFFQSSYDEREHYLYDDDTFYLTKFDPGLRYKDITEKFNLQNKYDGFTKAEMHPSQSGDSMDTKDGLIWLRIGDSFTPVKATYLNAYKDLYVYHNKVYANNRDLYDFIRHETAPPDPCYGDSLYKDKSIDLSNVKNPRELHRPLFSVFFDNQQQYSLKEDPLRLEKIAPHDYSRLTTTDYIKIKEKQIFINERQLDTDKFQDIPIFLGSIVDIIHDCDTNGPLAEIDYFYFFTDGKKVYAYINPEKNQKPKKPKVLDNVSPQNLKINDYDTLKKLLNISDGVNLH